MFDDDDDNLLIGMDDDFDFDAGSMGGDANGNVPGMIGDLHSQPKQKKTITRAQAMQRLRQGLNNIGFDVMN